MKNWLPVMAVCTLVLLLVVVAVFLLNWDTRSTVSEPLPPLDVAASEMRVPGAEAPGAPGDVEAQFTIELRVIQGTQPVVPPTVVLYTLDGIPFTAINSRYIYAGAEQWGTYGHDFLVVNEGLVDVTLNVAVLDAPTWLTVVVTPAVFTLAPAEQVQYSWSMVLAGDAPIGATALVSVQFVQ